MCYMQFGAMLEHSAASAASCAATGPGETRRDASTQCQLDVPTTVSVAVQCDIDCQPFTIQPQPDRSDAFLSVTIPTQQP